MGDGEGGGLLQVLLGRVVSGQERRGPFGGDCASQAMMYVSSLDRFICSFPFLGSYVLGNRKKSTGVMILMTFCGTDLMHFVGLMMKILERILMKSAGCSRIVCRTFCLAYMC